MTKLRTPLHGFGVELGDADLLPKFGGSDAEAEPRAVAEFSSSLSSYLHHLILGDGECRNFGILPS